MGAPADRPRVFISYSHDSDEHRERVYELSEQLRSDGVDCRIDRYEESPRQGWPQWMVDQIEDADFVLVVCTETYERRARGKDAPGTGLGATWEGAIISQLLYEQTKSNLIPVVFSQADAEHIPIWLKGATYYDVKDPDRYERLYSRLIGRPAVTAGPLGVPRDRASRVRYSRLVPTAELTGSEGEFFSIAFSPDARFIAGGSAGVVLVWDRQRLDSPLHVLEEPEGYVYSVAFSGDGKLAAGGEDHLVRVWDVDSGTLIWRDDEEQHVDAVYSVAFSPAGEYLASGGYDRVVNVWKAGIWQPKVRVAGSSQITSVAFSPGNPLLAVGALDDTVTLWNVRTEEQEHVFRGHTSSVETVAFSPRDGRLLASAGLDKTVRVWDVQKREEKWARKRHEYLVRAVAFSPDGATLASASWDKTVKLWDVEEGTVEETLPWTKKRDAHTDWIWSAAFSPRDVLLATGGSDSKIILWAPEASAPA